MNLHLKNMNESTEVFIDANVLIYYLDETSEKHPTVMAILQQLIDNNTYLYTSHHVLEEVLFIISKLSSKKEITFLAVQEISLIPNLVLVEPSADFEFAERYTQLYQESKVGINDTLLLQLILDAKIPRLFTYDKELIKQANLLGIKQIYD